MNSGAFEGDNIIYILYCETDMPLMFKAVNVLSGDKSAYTGGLIHVAYLTIRQMYRPSGNIIKSYSLKQKQCFLVYMLLYRQSINITYIEK